MKSQPRISHTHNSYSTRKSPGSASSGHKNKLRRKHRQPVNQHPHKSISQHQSSYPLPVEPIASAPIQESQGFNLGGLGSLGGLSGLEWGGEQSFGEGPVSQPQHQSGYQEHRSRSGFQEAHGSRSGSQEAHRSRSGREGPQTYSAKKR